MQSTIPEGAPHNPYKPYVESYANYKRNYHPNEYQRFGAYRGVEVPEQIRLNTRQALINIQNLLLPTIRHLRNERNVAELQDKVYRKLQIHAEEFNTCHLKARNIDDSYFCGNQLLTRLTVDVPQQIKVILDEY